MKIKNYLVIADLHIGITSEFYENGVLIPAQAEDFALKINALNRMTRTSKTIILGDVKHKVPGTSFYEKNELVNFFDMLDKKAIVVRGNHDVSFSFPVPLVDKIIVGDYFLSHGHMKIKTNKTAVLGHNHPVLRMKDALGNIYTEQVWVRSKHIILMPAFNPLAGGHAVNDKCFSGPAEKAIKNPDIYLLDGTFLGKLNDVGV